MNTTNSQAIPGPGPISSSSISQARLTEANRKLETAAQAAAEWGLRREAQIKELEAKLASELSNSRAIHNLLVSALDDLENNRQRADKALNRHVPYIYQELKASMDSLADLQGRLPQVREQVKTICKVYDSGRSAAQGLLTDLEWTHTPLQDKAYRIIFTRTAPVSTLEISLARTAFILLFLLFAWQFVGALDGAYRAYRYRLVWGDKIIS